ncbi:MAG: diguanylate cyclase [Pirellulaceae bacterium]
MEDQAFQNLTESRPVAAPPPGPSSDQLFQRCLIDNLREGVVMVDRHLKVKMWSQTAEQLTGIRGPGMIGSKWLPSHIDLRDRFDKSIPDSACPVAESIRKAEQTLIAATLTGRGGRKVAIDLHSVPVIGHDLAVHGATILLHDLSSQLDLEQQVLTLYAHATRDQLTGVANRAHFERSLDARIKEFQDKGTICSLIVADIDFFKKVNDDFGHHVGDHALMSFAKILQQNTRVHDLVARYGGEEFVIICPNCSVEHAMDRAEEIRTALEQTPLASLNGKCVTASFGVTEFQEDDSAISAFVRADQALLNAKENGRNQVQKLQTQCAAEAEVKTTRAERQQMDLEWRRLKGVILQSEEGETSSPLDVVIQKIKGFVSDNNARIIFAEPDNVRLRIDKIPSVKLNAVFDRHTPLLVDIETREGVPSRLGSGKVMRMKVSIRVVKTRDRRHKDLERRVNILMRDLLEHLSISKLPDEEDDSRY